ncbi:MAG: hypothetical protein RBR86_09530 [Pseudobdellovibrionaceae bacterium]|nr:hypothetical protein [Pseudobdellovibrionaceae bacterium]
MNRIWRHLSSVMAYALLTSAATTSVSVAQAIAADLQMKVRGSDHNDYSRLVFEGAAAPKYIIKQDRNSAVITFEAPVSLQVETAPPENLERVVAYKKLSDTQIKIDFPAGISLRHFILDKKLILDFKGHAKPQETSAAIVPPKKVALAGNKNVNDEGHKPTDLTEAMAVSESPAAGEEETKKETPSIKHVAADHQKEQIENAVSKNVTLEKHIVVDESKENAGDQQSETLADEHKAPELKLVPHTINIAGTTSFALAVFEKSGKLWFVLDKPDVVVPPQFEGPYRSKFDGFERMTSGDTTIFRTPQPTGYTLTGSGGGLVWDVKMTELKEGLFEPKPLVRADNVPGDSGPSLLWSAPTFHRAVKITDPDTGETIWVGMVSEARDFARLPQKFAELESLPSVIGMALVSKVDDLSVSKIQEGALISRPEGLALSMKKDLLPYKNEVKETPDDKEKSGSRIYNFADWEGGSTMADLYENQRLILSGLQEQTDLKKTEGMLFLGRMMLAHGLSPEAKGFFDLAESYTPELSENTEYKALRGASELLSGHFKSAFENMSNPVLDQIDEVKIWKSAALSGLDDWQQAAKTLPVNVNLIKSYPKDIFFPMSLRLAEIALREGNQNKAEKILEMVDARKGEGMSLAYKSSFDYLKGEYARQKGDIDTAKELWSQLETGQDDLYRAKSRLAMATLRYGEKEITLDKAIDTLEGLRYAWRGDELETSINYNLGKLYLEKGEPIKALGLMRLASGLIPNSEMGKTINQVMHATFRDLYLTDKIQDLSPLEALTMYDEFSELVPQGAEGDRLARQLAERLADVDLLPRAINLLKNQVDTRLSGVEGGTVAIRLASMQVLDNKPEDALKTLDQAMNFLKDAPTEEAEPKRRQIALLKAKAYSLMNKPQDSFAALSLLSQDEDVLRLRADIAWKSKKWQEAADSLEQLVSKQNISLTRPLTEAQAKLIMDWAVALYLADNRYVLANLRERYSDSMSQTSRAKEFEVITRPRQNILLADRDTIKGIIGETDMFRDFLESMKEDLTGPVKESPKAAQPRGAASSPSTSGTVTGATSGKSPANIPEPLKNAPPEIKTDEVLAD